MIWYYVEGFKGKFVGGKVLVKKLFVEFINTLFILVGSLLFKFGLEEWVYVDELIVEVW